VARTLLTAAAITTAAVAACALSSALKVGNGASLPDVALTAAGGLLFVAAGLVAMRRRPANRTGALMVGVGFALFLEDLQLSRHPGLFTVGLALASVSAPMLAWLVLAYPDGRLGSRPSRALVVAGWVVTVGFRLVEMTVQDVSYYRESNTNLLFVAANESMVHLVAAAQRVAGAVIAAAILAVMVRRWVRASPPRRRLIAPVYFASALCGAAGLLSTVAVDLFDNRGLYRVLITVFTVSFALLPILFLFGVLGTRLRAAPVVGMLAELSHAPTGTDLEQLLRAALKDPSLTLVRFPLSRPANTAPESEVGLGPTRAVTPIEIGDRRLGLLVHDPALADDEPALAAVTDAAALALQNQQLSTDVADRLGELQQAAARLVDATDQARRRIERDLHDGAQQQLLAVALRLRLVEQQLAASPDASALVAASAQDLEVAVGDLRSLARGLHPALLAEAGLAAAVLTLADRCPVPVDVRVDRLPPAPAAIETTAYFIVAEALTNIAKHAGASHAWVQAAVDGHWLRIEVGDDGVGGTTLAVGGGLQGLRDRARAVSGELTVTPAGAAGGTTVRALLPLGAP
jgi:signal transduction histidine kinase